MDSSGNGHRLNTSRPQYPRGHFGGGAVGGFRGQTFKSLGKLSNGWTDWHQLWFMSADSSGNGHTLNTSRPSIPQGAFQGGGHLGGGLGIKLSKVLGSCQTAVPIGTKFGTCLQIHLGMDTAKYNSPLNTTGGISGVLGGHKFKSG